MRGGREGGRGEGERGEGITTENDPSSVQHAHANIPPVMMYLRVKRSPR